MKTLLWLIAVIFLVNATKGGFKKEWKYFKLEFNKTYNSNAEEQRRFKIFKDNWNNIQKHNKRYEKGQATYLQEINRFGDMTDQEFTDKYGLNENDGVIIYAETLNKSKSVKSKDDYLDWRELGAVTPAKDQGSCGSCWIFSAIATLESYNFIKTGKLVPLSEQYIVDCYSNSSCDGGDPELAFKFMNQYGVRLENDYPYNAKQNECQNLTKPTLPIIFNHTAFINSTEDDDLKIALKKNGPMSICLYVTYRWRFYKSGVWYNPECSDYSNHCILLVGYGTDNGNDYWLFKNSWGPHWGQDGFIKVARNKHVNYCGINTGNNYLV